MNNSHIEAYFLERLRIAEDRNFRVFVGSIFEFRERNKFDIVLALNIFHHFLRSSDSFRNLVDFLRSLDMRYMFLETHVPNEPQMQGAYRNYEPDEFVTFVLENSTLTQAHLLGSTEDGRRMYLLAGD